MRSLSHYFKLFSEFVSVQKGGTLNLGNVAQLGKQLKIEGFIAESDVCLEMCIRAMDHSFAARDINACLDIEGLIYNFFVKTTETEDHYRAVFSRFSEKLQLLGREQGRPFVEKRDINKICFVIPTGYLLGHTEVMLETIDGFYAANVGCQVFCGVLGDVVEPALMQMLEARGVTLLHVGSERRGPYRAVEQLRALLEDHRVHTAVWVSVPIIANYALALRLAPRQIYWSMKLHPFFIPEVDVHICTGHAVEFERVYHEQRWKVAPFPLTNACRKNDPSAVINLRRKFPADCMLVGTLAREEKFNQKQFLSAICTILSANPNVRYIWTGKSQPPGVISTFRDFGVLDRCHFVGWVDTNLFAEALDVFFESFPFGCGVTGYQAMGHGTPVLSMRAPDTLYGLIQANEERDGTDINREDLERADILTAISLAHYVELGNKLISSTDFRRSIGKKENDYFVRERAALPRIAQRLWDTMVLQERWY